MNQSISAQELFDQVSDRLDIRYLAGKAGNKRSIESSETQHLRPALAGFLNLVHPNNIQILGSEELAYLDALDSRKRWETVAEIFSNKPCVLIVSDGIIAPDDLVETANESSTPLWVSKLSGVELVSHLQHHLSRALARSTTVHGVFMEVFSIGVLITGDSGSGKSELALELMTRGHRLIADDAPLMTIIAPDVVDGTCPDILQDCLEVRGLGVLNVRAMFGDSAVKPNKYLKLIVNLELLDAEGIRKAPMDRLHGDTASRDVLGVTIPSITIPVAPGRNIAVIVEAAVRNYSLKLRGYDAADEFLRRHNSKLEQDDKKEP